jgi:Sulfocyanin (SoxE) domain
VRTWLSLLGVCLLGAAASLLALAAPGVDRWLSRAGSPRTVSLVLIAGYNDANNGFNFDGYGRGMLLVRIPLGWRVLVTCKNASSLRHSCAVASGTQSTAPAFAGAATPAPLVGLLGGGVGHFAFVAARAGSYRVTSLVPGDEQARLWDVLVVGGVTRPSIVTRNGF